MKYTLILLLSTTIAFAQQNVINGNFEDTLIIPEILNQQNADTNARYWTMSDFGAGVTSDAQSGSTAAYIWNWYYYAKGEITNGVASFTDGGGTPINFKPTQLSGFYKYIPGEVDTENDSAQAIVCLTKYNTATSKRDTIGLGIRYFTATADYTAFDVNITYFSSEQPDTVVVKFRSSLNGFCANTSSGNCLFLYIDEVALKDEATGIRDAVKFRDQLNVFPNPAAEKIRVEMENLLNEPSMVRVYNTLGENILTQEITEQNSMLIDVSMLPRGAYVVRMNNATGRFVKE